MAQIICVRLDWNHNAIPLRIASRYHTLHYGPEPAHPFGRRGLAMAGAWHQLTNPAIAGMLVLDGDVAIDPHDHHHMLTAIDTDPDSTVHTAPVVLWPTSTRLTDWVWGHGTGGRFTPPARPAEPARGRGTANYHRPASPARPVEPAGPASRQPSSAPTSGHRTLGGHANTSTGKPATAGAVRRLRSRRVPGSRAGTPPSPQALKG